MLPMIDAHYHNAGHAFLECCMNVVGTHGGMVWYGMVWYRMVWYCMRVCRVRRTVWSCLSVC